MSEIGYPLSSDDVDHVFRVHFDDRRVIRVDDRVLKARPLGDKAEKEASQAQTLISSYRFSGGHFPGVHTHRFEDSDYLIIDMPHIGYSLKELGTSLDYQDLGYDGEIQREYTFTGFRQQHIQNLVDNLERAHRNFSDRHGLIHGDLFQVGSPNNILYNPSIDRLLLIDAEALGQATPERIQRFEKQMGRVEEWMNMGLLD